MPPGYVGCWGIGERWTRDLPVRYPNGVFEDTAPVENGQKTASPLPALRETTLAQPLPGAQQLAHPRRPAQQPIHDPPRGVSAGTQNQQ
jgi:hypothetical protein